MNPEVRAKLMALGVDIAPAMIQGTVGLMAACAAPRDADVEVTRDQQYGPDARNRLDVFRKGVPSNAPVLVYVHGGGFVMGDKTSPGSPFYDNVGQWAAQQGFIGVTMTYRLAPQHRWPAGPVDMALAVRWLREHVGALGGNPDGIFLMGQSAGAAHVAAYVAHPQFHTGGAAGLAGALMISGILDPSTQVPNQYLTAYFGEDRAVLAQANSIPGLLAAHVPMLFSVSELDPADFQAQATQLAQAWYQAKGRVAPLEYLAGHNHLTPAQAIGSPHDDLGPRMLQFIATHAATGASG